MAHNQHLLISTHDSNIRTWTHGVLPMPDWVPQHIAGGIEANGTFVLEIELGRARVHLGNIVIERRGSVWVRAVEDANDFIEDLKLSAEPIMTNVGPGKCASSGRPKRRRVKRDSGDGSRNSQRSSVA